MWDVYFVFILIARDESDKDHLPVLINIDKWTKGFVYLNLKYENTY